MRSRLIQSNGLVLPKQQLLFNRLHLKILILRVDPAVISLIKMIFKTLLIQGVGLSSHRIHIQVILIIYSRALMDQKPPGA